MSKDIKTIKRDGKIFITVDCEMQIKDALGWNGKETLHGLDIEDINISKPVIHWLERHGKGKYKFRFESEIKLPKQK